MEKKNVYFIGGGRITKIFLTAFKTKNVAFDEITVYDVNPEVLKQLKEKFVAIKTETAISENFNKAKLVFLAVHPPVIAEVLGAIKGKINPHSVLVSLAPKFTMEKISTLLGGFGAITRLLPLASSVMGKGYNPMVFAAGISPGSKSELSKIFEAFGENIEVAESKMEAYAMIVAMGPTYLWFQYYKLIELAKHFGMDEMEAKRAVQKMLEASSETIFNSGLDKNGVLDFIPVKPIGEHEADILKIYDEKLNGLFQKIKP